MDSETTSSPIDMASKEVHTCMYMYIMSCVCGAVTSAVCDVGSMLRIRMYCVICDIPQFDRVVEKALDANEADGGGYSREALPNEADFILAYSTVPGSVLTTA